MSDLQIISVSEEAEKVDIPDYPSISNEGLDNLEHVMRYGLALHQLTGIKSTERALPLHIHPITILSMIQEIRRSRK